MIGIIKFIVIAAQILKCNENIHICEVSQIPLFH